MSVVAFLLQPRPKKTNFNPQPPETDVKLQSYLQPAQWSLTLQTLGHEDSNSNLEL